MKKRVDWNLKRDYSPLAEQVGRDLMLNGNVSGLRPLCVRLVVTPENLDILNRGLASNE